MTSNRREILRAVGAIGAAGLAVPGKAAETAPLDSEKFRQAVLAGDLAAVTNMLDRDPALRYARNTDGVSVSTLACLKGQPKIAEELLRRGLVLDIFEAAAAGNTARVNELVKDDALIVRNRLPDGRTPLHIAAAAGKPEMVTALSSRGADLSAGPESPLLTTLDYHDHAVASEMSKFLLINASDPNARRRDGKTALQIAAARGYDDLVQMLLHRGADGPIPIDRVSYARRYTQDLSGKPVTRDDTYGLPQELVNQFSQVAHFDFEKVKQLQKLCPMLLFTRATWDELGIEAAAHMGLVPMAKYLADLGAPVSTCTATLVGAHDLVKRLLTEDPACIRERGAHDLPLLAYTAFGEQRVDSADLFLKSGADVNVTAFGQTTLHLAAARGHVELAELLLDRGADVNAKVKGRTPLDLAIQAKQSKLATLLKSREMR